METWAFNKDSEIVVHQIELNGRIATFDPTSGQRSFLGGTGAGLALDLQLQSKISNSAAEQTGLRDYMAPQVNCKGVGIVGN